MGNLGPSKGIIDRNLYSKFDRMPRELRELIANAPYEYAVSPFFKDLNHRVADGGRRHAVAQCLSSWPAAFIGDIGDDAYKIYGVDHPQAVKPVRKCRS